MAPQDRDPHHQRKRYPTREPERPAEPVRRYPRQEPEQQPPEQAIDSVRRYPRSERSSHSSIDQERTDSRSSRRPRSYQEPQRQAQRPYKRQTSYANPPVNATQQSEAAVFFKLLAKIAFSIVFLFLFIYFSFRMLTPYIPYSFEENISQNFIGAIIPEKVDAYEPARIELQTLAENLARHMNAPTDMPLHIHISSDKDLNAFATLGGHIVINKGTIDNVTSENALAMVLAHEIAHVKNRDPLTGMGTSALFSLVLAIVTGSDSGLTILGSLTELSFSRQQESNADKDALIALRSYYGHTQGADEFFSRILSKYGSAAPPAFMSSHPDTEKRLLVIRQDQIRVTTFSDLIPLSADLKTVQNHKPQRARNSRR